LREILVDTEEAFIQMEADLGMRRRLSLDTETNKLDTFDDDFELVGISLAGDEQTGYYIPVGHKVPPKQEDKVPKQLSRSWVMARLDRFLRGRRMGGANHKFDQHVFDTYGTCMGTTTFDALLAAPVLDSRDAMTKLDQLVFNKLGYKPTKIEDLTAHVRPKKLKSKILPGKDMPKKKQRMGFEFLTPEEALPYAAADAVDVIRLRNWFHPRLKADASLSTIMQLEIDVMPVLKRMEDVGLILSEEKVRILYDDAGKMVDDSLEKLRALSGNEELNPKSGKQMGDIIYHQMGIPHPRGRRLYKRGGTPPKGWLEKETREHLMVFVRSHQRQGYGGWSAAQVLEFLETYSVYTKAAKFRSTYTINLLDLLATDGRLHTELRQIVQTGRSASSSPNLQNLPRADDPITKHLDLRAALLADEGWSFVKADYAAQEMRIIAALSRDPTMLAIFTGQMRDDNSDMIDIHAYVGSKAFGEPYMDIINACRKKDREGYDALNDREKHLVKVRQDSKPVNFGIAYGITAIGLAVQIKSSERMAQKLINSWRTKSFPHAARWMDGQVAYLRQNLYTQTALGRKRKVSRGALSLSEQKFKAIARQFVNHPVQGSAADMTKQAMVRVDKILREKYGDDARLALVIHDELITLCKDEIAEAVKADVETAMATELLGIEFPVDGEIAKTMSKKAA
jgi:DNA polymerase-1